MELPLAYAFSAGMLACVNPCGAAMLPAWVSYYLGRGEPGDAAVRPIAPVARGMAAGLLATLGFLLMFALVGLVVSLGGRAILLGVPWAAVAIGIALVLVGMATLLGRLPYLALPFSIPSGKAGGWKGVFLFGVGYGTASLSCTLPIFLVVVGMALAAGGLAAGVTLFVSYALGMGVVFTGVTIAAAVFKSAVNRFLRRVATYFERASGVMLIGAGAYIVFSRLPYALS